MMLLENRELSYIIFIYTSERHIIAKPDIIYLDLSTCSAHGGKGKPLPTTDRGAAGSGRAEIVLCESKLGRV